MSRGAAVKYKRAAKQAQARNCVIRAGRIRMANASRLTVVRALGLLLAPRDPAPLGLGAVLLAVPLALDGLVAARELAGFAFLALGGGGSGCGRRRTPVDGSHASSGCRVGVGGVGGGRHCRGRDDGLRVRGRHDLGMDQSAPDFCDAVNRCGAMAACTPTS